MEGASILEKNLEVLAKKDSHLARAIGDLTPENYRLIPSARPGIPNLLELRQDAPPVLYYDPQDPWAYARCLIHSLEPAKAHLLVWLGMGLGYGLWELRPLLRAKAPLRKLFIVEQDPECFRLALEVSDLREILGCPQVEILVGVPKESLFSRFVKGLWSEMLHIKALRFVPCPAALATHGDYYREVPKAVSDSASTWMGQLGNDPFDTLVAYEHFLKNSQEVVQGPRLSSVKGLFPGRPAVVVASGPSLNKNVHLLKLVEERAVILAVDASWKILDSHGIQPHMVTSVERTPGTHRFVEGLNRAGKSVYAMVSFIFPETLASYHGPRLFVNRAYDFFRLLGMGEDCLAMGNSTAHMAFKIAEYMGCDPIILIGQDLAFDPSGFTHAQGCVHGERQIFFHEDRVLEVPGNMEPTVKTCGTWYKFLKQYEQHLMDYSGKCINATEGGAFIRGAHVMTFSQAIEQYCLEDFSPRDVLLGSLSRSCQRRTLEFRKGVLFLRDLSSQIIKWCREGLELLADPLAQVENLASQEMDKIPAPLAISLRKTTDRIAEVLDKLIWDPGPVRRLGEYLLQPCGIPFALEWHVLGYRFEDETWGLAYRLKLARDFLATLGQLCLSLDHAFESNRTHLGALMEGSC